MTFEDRLDRLERDLLDLREQFRARREAHASLTDRAEQLHRELLELRTIVERDGLPALLAMARELIHLTREYLKHRMELK